MTIFQDNLAGKYDVKYLKVVDDNIAKIYSEAVLYVTKMAGVEFTTEDNACTDSGDFMFDKASDYTFDVIIWAFPELLKEWDDQVTDLGYEVASILKIAGYASIKSLMETTRIAAQIIAVDALDLKRHK